MSVSREDFPCLVRVESRSRFTLREGSVGLPEGIAPRLAQSSACGLTVAAGPIPGHVYTAHHDFR